MLVGYMRVSSDVMLESPLHAMSEVACTAYCEGQRGRGRSVSFSSTVGFPSHYRRGPSGFRKPFRAELNTLTKSVTRVSFASRPAVEVRAASGSNGLTRATAPAHRGRGHPSPRSDVPPACLAGPDAGRRRNRLDCSVACGCGAIQMHEHSGRSVLFQCGVPCGLRQTRIRHSHRRPERRPGIWRRKPLLARQPSSND
jgi:hypothetical protein